MSKRLYVGGTFSLQQRGYQRQHARSLHGNANSVQQQKEQRQVRVDGSQKDVEAPGGHEEEESRDQGNCKTQAERRLIGGRKFVTWRVLEQRHSSQSAYSHRFDRECARSRRTDLPVAVPGHSQQQDESHDLARGRSLELESAETGEDDETAGSDAHPDYRPERPGVRLLGERVPDGESDKDNDSRQHACDGHEELVVHASLLSVCRCLSLGDRALVGAHHLGVAENGYTWPTDIFSIGRNRRHNRRIEALCQQPNRQDHLLDAYGDIQNCVDG